MVKELDPFEPIGIPLKHPQIIIGTCLGCFTSDYFVWKISWLAVTFFLNKTAIKMGGILNSAEDCRLDVKELFDGHGKSTA